MKNIAVVTGGATGLGYCLTEELLKKGHNVCILGRRENKLAEAKEALSAQYGDKIQYVVGNISDEEFANELFANFEKNEEHVQYLFNCAGTGQFGPVENNTRKMIDIALDASLIGLILMSSKAVSHMKEDGGVIVNIMSTAALKGKPGETVYCAAKWGARGFTEALREAVKGTKTKVISVYPGGMATDFWSPECGVEMNTSKFMKPAEVAQTMLDAILDKETLYVSELTIDRK